MLCSLPRSSAGQSPHAWIRCKFQGLAPKSSYPSFLLYPQLKGSHPLDNTHFLKGLLRACVHVLVEASRGGQILLGLDLQVALRSLNLKWVLGTKCRSFGIVASSLYCRGIAPALTSHILICAFPTACNPFHLAYALFGCHVSDCFVGSASFKSQN